MTLHIVAALISMTALLLYADRSAWLIAGGGQTWSAVAARAGIWLWMVSNCTAFVNLAVTEQPFLWRHWLVMFAMSVTVAGHLGLRLSADRAPT